MRASAILVLLLFSAGCGGNAVDLGHAEDWADLPATEMNTDEPQTLYRSYEQVLGFTADDTTLYALITRGVFERPSEVVELVSCPIEACKTQRKTLYSGPLPSDIFGEVESLTLVAGSLVFLLPDRGIASCSVLGCSELAIAPATSRTLAADERHVYWIDAQTTLMRLAPGDREAEPVRSFPGLDADVTEVSARGAFFYFVTGDRSLIYRIPKDGSSDPEPFVTDDTIVSIGEYGERLYYSSGLLAGRIAHCDVQGCESGPVTLAEQQRWPGRIRIDHSEIFWFREQYGLCPSERAFLASCALPQCASIKAWVGAGTPCPLVPYDFVVNRKYVVWRLPYKDFGDALRLVPR